MEIRKKKSFQLILTLFLLFLGLFYSHFEVSADNVKFRTIGYIQDYELSRLDATVDLNQFTDVNYFSMEPQADGNLVFSGSGSSDLLKSLVKKAHSYNVRVGVSIGGWGLSDHFVEATSDEKREKFIKEIVEFAKEYGLDTVDIDWEYPSESEAKQFDSFIKELRDELAEGIALSITVPSGVAANGKPSGRWEKHFLPGTLKLADWINIMSYDAQVNGYPHHSPAEMQKQNLEYWNKALGGKHMNQLVAGIPFYGKAESGAVLTYRNIIGTIGKVPTTDEAEIDGEVYYFNGKQTVKQKVEETIALGGLGVMIWAPTLDADLGSSGHLMTVVSKTIESSGVPLDKTVFLASVVSVDTMSIWKKIFIGLAIILIITGILLMCGKLLFLLPKQVNGRRTNLVIFGRIIGVLTTIAGLYLLLYLLLPLVTFLAVIALMTFIIFYVLLKR